MKLSRLVLTLLLIPALFACRTASAMERAFGYSRILSSGAPAPGATVTVRNAGSVTLSTIYADNLSTPKANPFTADSSGYWFFYAVNGRYDITFSGGGISSPYTLSDFLILDSTAVSSICGVSGAGISLGTSTTGTDFTLTCNDATDTITYNLPSASATARGLVTTAAQTFAGAKTFSTPIAAGSGGTGVNGAAAANGNLLIGNGAGFTLAPLTGTANRVSVTNGPGSITLSGPQDLATTSAPSFTTVTLTADWPQLAFGPASGAVYVSTAGNMFSQVQNNGELLIGSTGADPNVAPLGAGTGITVTNGPGSIAISNAASLGGQSFGSTAAQTFAVASSGADFGISSAGGVHTFSLPDASNFSRGAINTGTQDIAGVKTFQSTVQIIDGITGVQLSGTNEPAGGVNQVVLAPTSGTGTGTAGSVQLWFSHRVTAGTTPHTPGVAEEWQGGTAADPVTDEAKFNGTHGELWVRGVTSELLTLSTVGATTNTSNNLLPADAIIEAVVTRVTTTISGGGVANFSVGDSTTAARFSASAGGLTSGSTRVGLQHQRGSISTDATGPTQTAAASVRITCDATPAAGAVRVTVFYRRFVAPTS